MKPPETFPSINVKRPDRVRPNGRPYRVMVVEDKEFQRKLIAQILESEGYEIVATAANGQEALKKFDKIETPIDLVTTNLDMPVLDGYALVYELNQKPSKPVIVFISEETTKGVMQDLITMGIGDYILKPVNRRVQLERIKAVVQKNIK
jgi:PleD family two-component response regulator